MERRLTEKVMMMGALGGEKKVNDDCLDGKK